MSGSREYLFLILTLVFSIPFYIWGALSPVSGLPFGLPISFLMIFVPMLISLIYAWNQNRLNSVNEIFISIIRIKKRDILTIIVSFIFMPIVLLLTFYIQKLVNISLPDIYKIEIANIPIMLLLYFLGAIPEEIGWTYTITKPLVKKHGIVLTGTIIGSVWAIWHVVPWSWTHSISWILGMFILNILMRIVMIYLYINGNRVLLSSIIFHTMINVSFGLFPINGSYVNTWISVISIIVVSALAFFIDKKMHLTIAST